MEHKNRNRCGWSGSIAQFIHIEENEFIAQLTDFVGEAKDEQVEAWRNCYHVLQKVFRFYKNENWQLFFEYELPREGGRRPDVLLLIPGELLVLEFKMRGNPRSSDWEQLSSYVRDFNHYHESVARYSLQVRGALVLTFIKEAKMIANKEKRLYLTSGSGLVQFIAWVKKKAKGKIINSHEFLQAQYERLPTIVEAARAIMQHEPIPSIRKVNNTNIPQVLDTLSSIVDEARITRTHHLVLLTGVPGAGKTLVGLQFSHMVDGAVYLSGNGPLVDVLQDALGNKTFVQALKNFKWEHLKHRVIPNEHIFIFDEAQRAWDSKKMRKDFSEPDLMVQIAQDQKEWSVIIGLIGEGQEIYEGEEGGLPLWNTAIRNGQWTVHSNENLVGQFPNAVQHETHQHLNLNVSLRSHLALGLHSWVHHLLTGNINQVKTETQQLKQDRFTLYVSRDLERIKAFILERYQGQEKQIGFVTSSRREYGIRQPYPFVKGLPVGSRYTTKPYVSYYNHEESDYFSSKLQFAASEFETQGLELDLAVVCWGYDLTWNGGEWLDHFKDRNLIDPKRIRLNSYRVLLTRGRDGMIIYLPDIPHFELTYSLFKEIGVEELR
ncbi:DNA/RNA helicase domain-containing protein [Neobacillus sp. 179-C4.2 HS]|uniref:DNA/RNA helicase domain-containing protein n=1 Tax=Neobacillus driksii TaxID=3035913 RepID=A0ABV4YRE4_9BACI|nr:DNA/RNA helicase domain-containing protein [Neobacillus sp. 179.-C4.2 HS]MDP5195006.1 DUF2075 domain-containing protein [Neobacillus sp. 179.-C4.2 HS]